MKLNYFSSFVLLLLSSFSSVLYADEPARLVLIASANTTIPSLTDQDVRHLFLGVPTAKDGHLLIPLRNKSDDLIQEVFLQKVVFTSERNYERQLLSAVFRLGGQRPETFTDKKQLLEALRKGSDSVSYIWAADLKTEKGLKVLRELWVESQD